MVDRTFSRVVLAGSGTSARYTLTPSAESGSFGLGLAEAAGLLIAFSERMLTGGSQLGQIRKPFCHARAGFGGSFEDADAGANLAYVLQGCVAIETDSFGYVN